MEAQSAAVQIAVENRMDLDQGIAFEQDLRKT